MNAWNPQTLRGRLAELSPFEIKVAGMPKAGVCKSTALRREMCTDKVSTAEFYGCVDWYQYPGQAQREPENKARSGAER
jgi:hypothetical protein